MFISMIIVLCMGSFWMSVYFWNRNKIVRKTSNTSFFPSISVIVPAYNEEKNIANTLKAIFSSDYPKMEVIVVDDGSKDDTVKIAKQFPVNIIKNKINRGKIFGLNKGISSANNDIIFTIDADTMVEKDAFKLMVEKFRDPEVGAVSGVYRAVKKYSFRENPFRYFLEKFQSLEYMGFAMIRKQQEMLDSILVVPGAIAAYRKTAVIKAGGFDSDTLIEDYDMTMKLHKAGYKIRCDKNAVAWVVSPQTWMSLIRERTRWYRGGIQILRKHSDLLHTRVGAVTFVWGFEMFGMILQLVVFFLASAHLAGILATQGILGVILSLKMWMMSLLLLQANIFGYLVFVSLIIFAMGMVNTGLSIRMHEKSLKKLLLMPLMTIYTTFLSFVFVKSVLQEMFGKKLQWTKAEA